MAGVLAALMGSYGTGLNTLSSVLVNDYYRRFVAANRSERHYVFTSRVFTLVTTVALFLFATWQFHHRKLTASQRMGQLSALVAGPVACLFMLGVLSRRTNAPGAIVGGIAAIAFSLVFNGFPGLLEPTIKGINWMWISFLSTASGLGAGYFAS